MTIFISYSLGVYEQYILNLLSKKLAERGHTLVTNLSPSDNPNFQTKWQIQSAGLFLGIITKAGPQNRRSCVFAELNVAEQANKPAILLVEEGVNVGIPVQTFPNTIFFNPYNINEAIYIVQQKSDMAQSQESKPDTAAWVLGGLAVVALLAYLSDNKK